MSSYERESHHEVDPGFEIISRYLPILEELNSRNAVFFRHKKKAVQKAIKFSLKIPS